MSLAITRGHFPYWRRKSMSSYVEECIFLGQQAIRGGNEYLEMVVVPGLGSNVISLVVKEKNIQLLRVPDTIDQFNESPMLYGTPILFPPNRIADGRFRYGGRTYQFDINDPVTHSFIHGFVHSEKWKVKRFEVNGNGAVIENEIDSIDHEAIRRQFPHRFRLKMTFIIEGNTFRKQATVENLSEESFPWGLGYHTTFAFPLNDQCSFSLTVDRRWRLDGRFLPTGELEDLEQRFVDIPLKGQIYDDVFLSPVVQNGKNEAILRDENNGIEIAYQCDEYFTQWVVHNGNGKQGFFCVEPYTWVTNTPNLELPDQITGNQVIEPGGKKMVESEISVKSAD